ncbi:MAG: carbohydrate-binding family 9-like protein [Clostridium sp.]|uniref:carbohydrate-binding family 9-like protein n=1 Tax=Clostridium sp. TaxID=1506 RepID=UPI0030272EE2
MKYYVKKVKKYTSHIWDKIEGIVIDKFPWDKTGYKPCTVVKLFYTNNALHIRFISQEAVVRVESTKFNDNVYEDSAVEFFFMPEPTKDNRYFNFEINAAGVLLLQLDSKTYDRAYINAVDLSIFNIETDVTHDNYKCFSNSIPWKVEYEIPFSFIKTYFKDFKIYPGYTMKGNFYKTGSKTLIPHYGVWNYIDTPSPSFHKPEFFGNIIFE